MLLSFHSHKSERAKRLNSYNNTFYFKAPKDAVQNKVKNTSTIVKKKHKYKSLIKKLNKMRWTTARVDKLGRIDGI